jgi:hypothetical protein
MTRVRLSAPKAIAVCGEKGSARSATGSSAIARVEFARLNNTGAPAAALDLKLAVGTEINASAARQENADRKRPGNERRRCVISNRVQIDLDL